MTEITAEGHTSTTTTVIDGKNGSVPKTSGKVLKRSVTEDIVTTFSSPAAWLLVIALIITWSAVAVVMFDLVDYKNFSASSISKIGSDPLKIVHDAVEETTDWIYGFFSLLSDIISSDGEEDDDDHDGVDTDEGEEEEPPLKKKEIHKEKAEKLEKPEKKITPKVTHKEKPEKEKPAKEKPAKEKPAKEKPEKKASHKDKDEKKEKPKARTPPKDEKKSKGSKAEEKSKKEVKSGKSEKVKQADAKAKKVEKTPAKPKGKEEKGTEAVSKNEQKDQFAFCRYMIDMFAQGDLKPGQSPAIPPPLPIGQVSQPELATSALKGKVEEKKRTPEKKIISETDKESGRPSEARPGTIKVATQGSKISKSADEQEKKDKYVESEKSPTKESSAPSEKQVKSKTERSKVVVAAASTKKGATEKDEEKSIKEDEQGINTIFMSREFEASKTKTGKSALESKEKEPIKGKEINGTTSLKDREPNVKKEEKPTKTSSDKEEKPIKTSPQKEEKPLKPGTRKEEKTAKSATQKEEKPTRLASHKKEEKTTKSVLNKIQIHRKDTLRIGKCLSLAKPVQKVIKQTKAATTYKTAATTYKTAAAATYKTDKKKTEKHEKECKAPKKQPKEQKADRRGKENVRPFNGTKEVFDEMPKRSKAENEDPNHMNRGKGELWMSQERRGERETDRDRDRQREDEILTRKKHLTRSHQFLPVLLFGWVHWVRVPLPCYPSPSSSWEL
ncbi:triadin isoform X23 [Monodelphis domestica]|uniref:triadin isoform X23 n=1 Tax=Monodelphis domestica TaxID=13616 RepID=UPI0024E22449|nr:triadin isoform X23 [Monodelphis domestica]